jgi:hypothetical protein
MDWRNRWSLITDRQLLRSSEPVPNLRAAMRSDLGIDTEEASQVRVVLLSAAPGVSTVITGMRSVRNVDATRR